MPWFVAVLVMASAQAGKRDKDVVDACPGLPPAQRPVISVAGFAPQVPVPDGVGVALAGRIGTQLLTTNCFTVDLDDEAPRYRVTGLFTDYRDSVSAGKVSVEINGERTVVWRASVGLVLTLTDAKTGDVLVTKPLTTDGKARRTVSAKGQGPYGPDVSPAMDLALQAMAAETVSFLLPWRERLDVGR